MLGRGDFAFLGIDLESSGKSIIAVGVSLVTLRREVLHGETFSRYRCDDPSIEFCPSVLRFFARHPGVLGALDRASREAGVATEKQMVQRTYEFIQRWQMRARRQGFHVAIATDNPAFDVGELNALFRRHGMRRTLPQNLVTGTYERVYDVKSMCSMFAMMLPSPNPRERLARGKGAIAMVENILGAPPVIGEGGEEVEHSHLPHEDAALHAGTLASLFAMSLSLGKAAVTVGCETPADQRESS